ncbi:MAG: anti-virulence regulator CigR family protein [Gemmatimonadales bacterium]|jgi:hypothetical protein
MIRPAPFLIAAVALLALPLTLSAQGNRRDQAVEFTRAEREAIAAYFEAHPQEARPLPPGIARNLERGKPLPPGIAKRRLPDDLQQQLPEREGFEITIFGDRIVLLEASGLVVDILEGVFR